MAKSKKPNRRERRASLLFNSCKTTGKLKNGDEVQIIFRQLHQPIPLGWVDGVRWQIEAYPDGQCDLPYPMGIAWLSDYRPHNDIVIVDFMMTCDQFRREGVAKALLAAIEAKWPTVTLTDAISPSG